MSARYVPGCSERQREALGALALVGVEERRVRLLVERRALDEAGDAVVGLAALLVVHAPSAILLPRLGSGARSVPFWCLS